MLLCHLSAEVSSPEAMFPTQVKKKKHEVLTCGKCTGMAGGWPAGEPRWWSPAKRKAGTQGRGADREAHRSGRTGWEMNRSLVNVDASLVRMPGAGRGASSKGTPGSMTSRQGSADRHWSKGWCGGPSLSFFSLSSTLSLSPHLRHSVHFHMQPLKLQNCASDYKK